MECEVHSVGSLLGHNGYILRVIVVERLDSRELVVSETHIMECSLSIFYTARVNLVVAFKTHAGSLGIPLVGIDVDGKGSIVALVNSVREGSVRDYSFAPLVGIAVERAYGIPVCGAVGRTPGSVVVACCCDRLTVELSPIPCVGLLSGFHAINIVALYGVQRFQLGRSHRSNALGECTDSIVGRSHLRRCLQQTAGNRVNRYSVEAVCEFGNISCGVNPRHCSRVVVVAQCGLDGPVVIHRRNKLVGCRPFIVCRIENHISAVYQRSCIYTYREGTNV